jgi:hypothetical protein
MTDWQPSVPERAYRNDVRFKQVVDMLEALIHQAELTPHEVRAAAMLAMVHYEMRRPLNIVVKQRPDGLFDIVEEK